MSIQILHICFDLDGTLVDSHKTIYYSTLKSLEVLGIPHTIDEEDFRKMIGKHFVDIFEDMKIPVYDFDEFIYIYKNQYFDFIDDSELYPDVIEILDYLSKIGLKISLLTTKAQDQAEKILDHFGIINYFDLIMGRRNGIEHKPSAEPLLLICKAINVSPSESMIVGDTELDILCGKNANVRTCAVTHGYRTKESISLHKPDHVIEKLLQLENLFK
jgi:phosphoglycolate phosphatase/pyrophosphatase PpaX